MPELPEVEITRRMLEPILVGRTITRVRTTRPSSFFLSSPAVLRRRLTGARVDGLQRRGKYLLAELEDGSSLLLHLGMTGQLFTAGSSSPRLMLHAATSLKPGEQSRFVRDSHTHLELSFSDGEPRVLFRDVRKFGRCAWIARGVQEPRLQRLGVDALQVTADELHAAAQRRRCPIKALLLDQSVLAGVGNIYADEALFEAGITPRRAACRLSRPAAGKLAEAVRQVLERAIAAGGSSIDDFVRPDGSDGNYQEQRRVYGRTGEPCRVCGTLVRRCVVAQRSTHWCARCQR